MERFPDIVPLLKALNLDLSPTARVLVPVLHFLRDVQAGSHIAVQIREGGPWHHGVYAGDDAVIHLFGDDKGDAHVQQCSVLDFIKGKSIVAVVTYEGDSDEKLKASVQAAKMLMLKLPQRNLYDVRTFNCEHFAVLCRSGLERYDEACASVTRLVNAPCTVETRNFSKPPLTWQDVLMTFA